MATTTSITTTYAGEFASKYIAAALLSSPTIENGGVEILPNVKYKQVIQKVATGDLLADGSCDFAATSSVTLTERILEVKELQVNLQLCKKDFRSTWQGIEMGFSNFDVLPKSFADFLIAHVAEKVAAANEVNIWRGVGATAGQFAGLGTQIALDANLPAAQEVAGTTVDAANVIVELGKIVDAIPTTLYGKENLSIYVSQNIYKAYVRALGGFGADGKGANGVNGQGNNQSLGNLMFDGVNLFVAEGLLPNTAIAAEKDNLYFGVSLLADTNEVKVIDMSDIDGSQNVRVVMRMSAGTQYGIVEDIVTYGIVNSAN